MVSSRLKPRFYNLDNNATLSDETFERYARPFHKAGNYFFSLPTSRFRGGGGGEGPDLPIDVELISADFCDPGSNL